MPVDRSGRLHRDEKVWQRIPGAVTIGRRSSGF